VAELDAPRGRRIANDTVRRSTVVLVVTAAVTALISFMAIAIWESMATTYPFSAGGTTPTVGYVVAAVSVVCALGAAALSVVRLVRGDRGAVTVLIVSALGAVVVPWVAWVMTPRGDPARVLAIDATSGEVLWRRQLDSGDVYLNGVDEFLTLSGYPNDELCGGETARRWRIDRGSGRVIEESDVGDLSSFDQGRQVGPVNEGLGEYRYDEDGSRLLHFDADQERWSVAVGEPPNRMWYVRDGSTVYLILNGQPAHPFCSPD
jgi:hypothetical protein